MTYARDAAPPFYHGTRADLALGDHIRVGHASNFTASNPLPTTTAGEPALSWVYFSAALESAVWGCELAAGEGRPRIYIVEPTGPFEDDPNLTDKRFPGNPTMSYRSRAPLRIIGEVNDWTPHPPEQVQAMKDGIAALAREGRNVIED